MTKIIVKIINEDQNEKTDSYIKMITARIGYEVQEEGVMFYTFGCDMTDEMINNDLIGVSSKITHCEFMSFDEYATISKTIAIEVLDQIDKNEQEEMIACINGL